MKRILVCFTCLLLAGAVFAFSAWADAPEPLAIDVKAYGGQSTAALTDDRINTRFTAANSTTFTITAAEPMVQLYVIVDAPTRWVLYSPGRAPQTRGQNGFLHEYIYLDVPTKLLCITLPKGSKICEIYAFGPGEAPSWVQRWQPPCEKADLLVLPTHADDEHLWFGGTMPYYAGERQKRVQVAYMTNHWAEPYRPHELLNGLWAVGITNYPVVSEFADLYSSKESLESARRTYNEEAVTAFQVELLRRFKPEVVVGHDINGEYGHGAHILNATTLLEALKISNDEAAYPNSVEQYGVWQAKKCYLHLWPEEQIRMEWGEMPLEYFGGKTALQMAEEGFACHASQTQWFSVKASGKNDCRKFGLAYTTVGPDMKKNDLFEHIQDPL